ncbi:MULTISPECIES: hypothetical protein [unclassified Microcoleus]|uniref:hypothetical protein n=1 Tax=unclassified Microcoleus TaxID=2642155 RepID=UPI002FD45119
MSDRSRMAIEEASIYFNVRLLDIFGLLIRLGSIKNYTAKILRSIELDGSCGSP